VVHPKNLCPASPVARRGKLPGLPSNKL